ncbi:MAG: hypothetical protein AB1634_05270 [Thermodesulfobacteriota bacterium]
MNPNFYTNVLRRLRPDVPPTVQVAFPGPDLYFEEVRLHGPDDPVVGPYVMPLVTLRTPPCRWSVGSGCLMCGYHLASTPGPRPMDLMGQTERAIRRLDPRTYPALVFTSNGSFLDPAEVPDDTRPLLISRLRSAGFRFVTVESRAEYVTAERLAGLRAAFEADGAQASRGVSVSIGLESSDSEILRWCVNKGLEPQQASAAFEILGAQRVPFDCYVLLGKPFLSAREDVADALQTIRFAIDRGASYVFVMVMNLMPLSLTEYLQKRGRYHLPSLWRAVELLEALPADHRALVQVKGFSRAPVPPLAFATTCPRCEETVKSALNLWNQTADIEHLRALPGCLCRAAFLAGEWAETGSRPLRDRVREECDRLATELAVPPPSPEPMRG